MWLLLAFCGPVLWAASTHIDKYLVERFFKSCDVAVLLVFTSLLGIVALPLIAAFVPITTVGSKGIAIITIAGALYMGAMYFYLRALQGAEASVVAPLFQAAPVFTYALAFLFLHERLSTEQLIGGAAIISGAVIVSHSPEEGFRFRFRVVGLMLACTLALAFAAVIFKVFAVRDEFWTTTFWMFVGEAVFGIALLLVPAYRRQFAAMFRNAPGAVVGINAANELINLGGGLAARYASILGPVSLVQAIGGTTTFFVFAFGVALSFFYPQFGREEITRGGLLVKGAASVLVATGVILISRTAG